jgi:hypothetical protein
MGDTRLVPDPQATFEEGQYSLLACAGWAKTQPSTLIDLRNVLSTGSLPTVAISTIGDAKGLYFSYHWIRPASETKLTYSWKDGGLPVFDMCVGMSKTPLEDLHPDFVAHKQWNDVEWFMNTEDPEPFDCQWGSHTYRYVSDDMQIILRRVDPSSSTGANHHNGPVSA